MSKYRQAAAEIGALVDEKQAAYGDSFGKAGDFLRLLYPDGIAPEQYGDLLTVVRVFDKLMRIATDRDALGENPWKDIAGYAVLECGRDPREPCPATGRSCSTCAYDSAYPVRGECLGCGKYFANWQPVEDPPCDGCPYEETESYDEPCISCIDPLEMAEDYVERMRRDVREERAPHPGDVLRELLELNEAGVDWLAQRTYSSNAYWCRFLDCHVPINKLSALELSQIFALSSEFWLNLQRNYDAQKQTQAERR